jgi:hypothetical protein
MFKRYQVILTENNRPAMPAGTWGAGPRHTTGEPFLGRAMEHLLSWQEWNGKFALFQVTYFPLLLELLLKYVTARFATVWERDRML